MQVPARLVPHEAQHAIEAVPVAHETDEAEHEAARQSEPSLGGLAIRQARKRLFVDAIRYDVDALARHAGRDDPGRENLGDGQDQIGAAPDMVLGPLREPRQRNAAEATPLLGERRIDLEQQRHAEAPPRPDTRGEMQVVALVDHVGAEPADRRGEPAKVCERVAELERLVSGARQPALEAGDHARARTEALLFDVTRAHDLDVVTEPGEGADHLLEMHELPVLGPDAVMVEDPHAIQVLAMRRNSASWRSTDGPQAKRRA